MTKIDETKDYKFSEIIAMLENRELPEGTVLQNDYLTSIYKIEEINDYYTMFEQEGFLSTAPYLCSALINSLWTITLPKEVKYYLKAPNRFAKGNTWLNFNTQTQAYFLGDTNEQFLGYQTKFTKSEIDAMPFDTIFFGEPIAVGEEAE